MSQQPQEQTDDKRSQLFELKHTIEHLRNSFHSNQPLEIDEEDKKKLGAKFNELLSEQDSAFDAYLAAKEALERHLAFLNEEVGTAIADNKTNVEEWMKTLDFRTSKKS